MSTVNVSITILQPWRRNKANRLLIIIEHYRENMRSKAVTLVIRKKLRLPELECLRIRNGKLDVSPTILLQEETLRMRVTQLL